MDRVRKLKTILWMLTGVGAAVGIARFMWGLGAATNLSDATPWGLWIGFDVMSGVALAAGGFIITATVYIFKLERFHGIVRPAVLTAFLGYVAVAIGLLFDLGIPWHIWHMIVFWNPHSPLFEVGWCVMLYLTVLFLEFFPVPAEDFSALGNIRRFLTKFRLPLVIAGIALSTLHQSSLGSLFLIMPYHVHPLWYSPILPILFFISAIGLGLMMVTFESLFTSYHYRRKPETHLLADLLKAARWVLLLYFVLRLIDLAVRGQLDEFSGSGWQVNMFWVEQLIMVIIPVILMFIPRVRSSLGGQWTIAIMGVTGVVLNRINVGGLIHLNRGEGVYLPSWMEVGISAGVVSLAALVFLYFVEWFKVWEERPADPEADPKKLPEFDRVDATWIGVPGVAARMRYSLAFIVAMAFTFAFLNGEPASTRGIEEVVAQKARGNMQALYIDGNLDGYGVKFKHAMHERLLGGNKSCAKCHHMNLPADQTSGCFECHKQMYLPTSAFEHDWHASPKGANQSCATCHEQGKVRNADSVVKDCEDCHDDLIPAGSQIKLVNHETHSYVDAMHRMCVTCHNDVAKQTKNKDLARCTACHNEPRSTQPGGKGVVLPPVELSVK